MPTLLTSGGHAFESTIKNLGIDNPKQIKIPSYTWKLLVEVKPGQRFEDIDFETAVTAIMTPNSKDPRESEFPYSGELLPGKQMTVGSLEEWKAWETWQVDYKYIENLTKLKLFSNLTSRASLLSELGSDSVFDRSLDKGSILHDSVLVKRSLADWTTNPLQNGIREVSAMSFSGIQIGSSQIGTSKVSSEQLSPFSQTGFSQINAVQNSSTEVGSVQVSSAQVSPTQLYITQDSPAQVDTGKISFPIGIALQQLFGGHNSSSQSTIKWTNFLDTENPAELTFQVRDLSVGQLAETQITRFDADGHPIAGTIYIDDDANGRGWFIDSTPWESSEFGIQNTEYNYAAQEGSAAYGRYDLLTTLLHELSHFSGFIAGHEHFDTHVSGGIFRDGDLTASITADGSHIADNPYSLLSPYLTPGMRKLPSELELKLLESIRNHKGTAHAHGPISAAQTAILTGISNGDFEQLLAKWIYRGTVQTTQLPTTTAVTLTEDSPILSQLSQTFVIPQDPTQRYLTFDLLETTLGNTTHRPPDAFEVALLDSTTLQPLVGTAIGLTNTDALLNLQSNGKIYLDDDVTVTDLDNGHRRVRIDLGDLAPSTTATLYFDLLGFGAADSRITIDNITFGKGSTPPVATDDTATLTQGQSTSLNLLTNDTADQPLTPSQLTLETNPTQGSLTRDEQGNIIYNPFDGYAGIDSFTYRLTDSNGETSNLATVNLEILNAAPQIQTIALPNTATEGTPLSFTAATTDPGNDTLTYEWNFGDGSTYLTATTASTPSPSPFMTKTVAPLPRPSFLEVELRSGE